MIRSRDVISAAAVLAGLLLSPGQALSQISDDVVKIGVLNDQSGVYADVTGQGSVIAAQMAVEDFGGTVLGKQVKVIFADHQNKADVGSAIVRKWIDQDGVDAIADVPTSSVGLAVQEITREKKRVFLMSGPGTSDLTGKFCSPTGIAWTYDTYSLSKGLVSGLSSKGYKTWFVLAADYAFGQAMQRDITAFVESAGGKVVGGVRHPLNTADFSSFLLTAQSSKADVVALANAGGDTVNAIKQASEFGLTQAGQTLAGLLVTITDVNSLSLKTAEGLVVTTSFYWDMSDETRAWSKRFMSRNGGKVPNMMQAGVYGAVLHYLKAIKAAGTDEATTVADQMKKMPINDFYTRDGVVREDGRVLRDMYVMQTKSPSESRYPFDYYKLLSVIPGRDAFRPISEGGCPFVKNSQAGQ
ncbi:branched-chain amino acid transport system substrate-binding protein [Bradyrhizobium sp. S3.12.5]|uniref:ABC transporter substrate-binding protein n=1 Tax=Bradyrhizobium sp. S3.12.5 TaxID=3156386 RepID=UPI003393D7F0